MRSCRVAVAVCGALWRSSRDNNVCQQRCVCHGKVPYKVERSGWVHTDMALPPPAKKKREEPLPRPEMEVSRRRRGKESERGTGHDDGKKRTDARTDGLKWTQVAPPLLRDWMRLQIEILAVRAQRTHT